MRPDAGLGRSTRSTLVKEQLPTTIASRPDRTPQGDDGFVQCVILPRNAIRCEYYIVGQDSDTEIGKRPSIYDFVFEGLNNLLFAVRDTITREFSEFIRK